MIKKIAKAIEIQGLHYTIHKTNNDIEDEDAISLLFRKKDSEGREITYDLWLFYDEDFNSVNLFIPNIVPIMCKERTSNRRILEDKLSFLNIRGIYGQLELTKADTISFEYNFVYIDDVNVISFILKQLLSYLDFIVYETGILISKTVKLEEFIKVKESNV